MFFFSQLNKTEKETTSERCNNNNSNKNLIRQFISTVPITKSQMNNFFDIYVQTTGIRRRKKNKTMRSSFFCHKKMHNHMDGLNQTKTKNAFEIIIRDEKKNIDKQRFNHYIHSLYCFHWMSSLKFLINGHLIGHH